MFSAMRPTWALISWRLCTLDWMAASPLRPISSKALVCSMTPEAFCAVRRDVWSRDEGMCQWKMAGGGICGSTWQCELDHVVPFARGGEATADELRVLCAAHNDLAAREAYGDERMNRFSRGMRGQVKNAGAGRSPSPA